MSATRKNLRLLPAPAPSDQTNRFETLAKLRARVMRRACFKSQFDCAAYFGVALASVHRWECVGGGARVPGWYLIALEARCRELGVVVAEQPRRVAA